MTTHFVLAYSGYLIWILSGWADFRCHRKSDIAHTSGLAESVSHLWELGILSLAVFAFLLFQINTLLLVVLLAMVVAHAIAGYVDSTIAFTKARVVRPWEQFVHSVLNMAPWVALLWIGVHGRTPQSGNDWDLMLREPLPSLWMWSAVVGPPALLNVLPALREYWLCSAAVQSPQY